MKFAIETLEIERHRLLADMRTIDHAEHQAQTSFAASYAAVEAKAKHLQEAISILQSVGIGKAVTP